MFSKKILCESQFYKYLFIKMSSMTTICNLAGMAQKGIILLKRIFPTVKVMAIQQVKDFLNGKT